ncbi:MAG TPA: PQQ-binding-like beta-propeller repeat protein [Gaiellaceae bacterium]|nr:PQQ-binding-like beta-propeller repeat protein [Gaiellaceae bacterium]
MPVSVSSGAATKLGGDWTRFGYDAARSSSGPVQTGITAKSLSHLRRQQVQIGGTADSSPIYLRGVRVGGKTRDVFFLTTSYGKAVAVDASSGRVLWTFTPSGYSKLVGSDQITNSSPVADPSRTYVYSASPDGKIHKLAVANGHEARGWPVTITLLPKREKIGVALNFSHGLVLASTGGYYGDTPPYQGHVAAIAAATGRIVHVWNSLCSDEHRLIEPSSCTESDSAIWARSGVVVEPDGNLLVATGNGKFDGKRYWGDSVLELSPDAGTLLQNWTPANQDELNRNDADLGSTAPALLGNGLAAQSGKDGKLRLLDLAKLNGKGGAGATTGGELQTVSTPSGSALFSAPAVWRQAGTTWMFVADGSATAGYVLSGRKLRETWNVTPGGTSPVVAGGLLYVLDASRNLDVYAPTTGKLLAALPAGPGHWSSPIVTDGRIALPVGNANDHAKAGVLDIWRPAE